MLACLLFLVYTFAVAWVAGICATALVNRLTGIASDTQHPSVTVLSGLCFIAVLLQPFHLIHAIDGWAHLYIGIVLGGVWWFTKKYHPESKIDLGISGYLVLAVAVVAACINGIARAGTGDIGDYHLQAIRWMEEYATVPGLGNLRRQLGNNSSWFLLHAFTGLHFTGLRSVYTLNTVLLITGIAFFIPQANDSFLKLKTVILIYLSVMAYRKYVGAVTNDYAITVYTLVFWSWLYMQHRMNEAKVVFIGFITLTLVTFKLSAVAGLLIPLWLYTASVHKQKLTLQLALVALVILIPWIYTTYLHSGYFVYPVAETGFLHPDWQMPAEQLHYERAINIANERVPGVDVEAVLAMPFTAWFPLWVQKLDYFSIMLLVGAMCAGLYYAIRFIQRKVTSDFHALFISLTAVTLIIWFTQAPAIRFVFGALVFFIAYTVQSISFSGVRMPNRKSIHYACAGILLAGGLVFLKQIKTYAWLYPEPYTRQTMNYEPVKNGYVWQPAADQQCWDSPLPCTGLLNKNMVWRSENMKDGFRIEND